jgi:UDP-N-acetylmuramate: L-alanyl-gamma-D-glutamyl-meso-diaminopimelate ligase
MSAADHALVYFSPEVVAHKKLEPLNIDEVQKAFGGNVVVKNTTEDVLSYVGNLKSDNTVLLMMSSGNFDGIDYDALGSELSG